MGSGGFAFRVTMILMMTGQGRGVSADFQCCCYLCCYCVAMDFVDFAFRVTMTSTMEVQGKDVCC